MSRRISVIVTGGSGFIGSHIVDECLARGWTAHIVDIKPCRRSPWNRNPELDERCAGKGGMLVMHLQDITDITAVYEIFRKVRPDYVFHLAALPSVPYSIENPEHTWKVNFGGTLNVLACVKEVGVKSFIYSASSSAYGDQEKMPLSEDVPVSPKSPYAEQKLASEVFCLEYAERYRLKTISLRYFNVYGSRMDLNGAYASVVGRFFKLRGEGKPLTITGDGEQTRDFVHVSDVTRANLLAVEAIESGRAGGGEVVNIGSGKSYSVNAIAAMIGGSVEYVAPRVEPRHSLADIRLAEELLGWKPRTTFEKGLYELKKEWKL